MQLTKRETRAAICALLGVIVGSIAADSSSKTIAWIPTLAALALFAAALRLLTLADNRRAADQQRDAAIRDPFRTTANGPASLPLYTEEHMFPRNQSQSHSHSV